MKDFSVAIEWWRCPPCPCWGLKALKSSSRYLVLSLFVLQVWQYDNIRVWIFCAFAVLKNATLTHSCTHPGLCESLMESLGASLFLRIAAEMLSWASPPDTLLSFRPWLSLLHLPQVFLMLVLGDEVIYTYPGAAPTTSPTPKLFRNHLFQLKKDKKIKIHWNSEYILNWQYKLSGKTVSANTILREQRSPPNKINVVVVVWTAA